LRGCSAADFEHIWVTDTVPLAADIHETMPNLTVLSVAGLVGEAIQRIHRHESISALFT
jgi:ribose-phosphate pyrophosphokinase